MSYTPKAGQEENIENLVAKRIDEILRSVKGVSNMYVEPGDVIIFTVSEDTDEKTVFNLRKVLSSVFDQNKGLFVTDNITFKVVKRGESDGAGQKENEETVQLKQEIQRLKERLESLEAFVSKYTPV